VGHQSIGVDQELVSYLDRRRAELKSELKSEITGELRAEIAFFHEVASPGYKRSDLSQRVSVS
jgi:hypothetical protein